MVRQKIWGMLEGDSKVSSLYNIVMTIVIIASLIPLIFKNETAILLWFDHITVAIFIVDYILRWVTAKYKFNKGRKSFLIYPVSPWAILDLICIIPSFQIIASGFKILKVARLSRTLRVFRSLKLLREAKNMDIVINVLKGQWRALMAVLGLAAGYVLVVALVMFNMEPDTFDSFFHSVYWSTISLTTIGYGDVFPQSTLGQAFTIVSAFVGIAIIALPSGIIAGGFMSEINRNKNNNELEISLENDPFDSLEKLDKLCDEGIISEEEFSSKKAELLDRI